MKIKYFQGTDTLYIEFRADRITETRDLDENTLRVNGVRFTSWLRKK